MLDLLKLFRDQGWHVDFASPAELSVHRFELNLWGISEHNIALNCSSFDEFVQQLQPDLVLFDRFMLEEQFGARVRQQCPSAITVLDLEDLHFLRHARHEAVKQGKSANDANLFSDMAKRELAAIMRCDLTLVISPFEMQLLTDTFNVSAASLIYYPLTCDEPETQTPTFDQRTNLVSIGNFRHAPNWDAVLQLKQLWPSIRQHIPAAQLHIYGAYPPKKATQLHNEKQGFLVKGWAEDAYQVIRNARLLLAPLRFGAGQKGKLLDAMQCQTPSITTPIGAEGMYESAGWPGIIASDDDSFIHGCVALYQDPTQWQQAQQKCTSHLTSYFSAKHHHQRLLATLERIRTHLTAHRNQHFIAQILQHQTLNASKYMSQWIEAKNQSSPD